MASRKRLLGRVRDPVTELQKYLLRAGLAAHQKQLTVPHLRKAAGWEPQP